MDDFWKLRVLLFLVERELHRALLWKELYDRRQAGRTERDDLTTPLAWGA